MAGESLVVIPSWASAGCLNFKLDVAGLTTFFTRVDCLGVDLFKKLLLLDLFSFSFSSFSYFY